MAAAKGLAIRCGFLFDFGFIKYDNGKIGEGYRGGAVPLTRLLQEASFGPDEISRLSAAYEGALKLLRLKSRADPLCELIAAKVIQVYRSGESDPPKICARAIRELGVPIPD